MNLKKPFKKAFTLLILFQGPLFVTPIDKGLDAIARKEFSLAVPQLEKAKKTMPALAYYGMAQIFSIRESGYYNLDSAYFSANRSLSSWDAMSKREHSLMVKRGILKSDVYELITKIENLAFDSAKSEATVTAFESYMTRFPVNGNMQSAIHLRDSVAFYDAEKDSSAASYLAYMNRYPASEYYGLSKNKYHRLIYEESVDPSNVKTYEVFVRSFPANPHVDEAWQFIFQHLTRNVVDPDVYHDFITKYPTSPLVGESWFRLRESFFLLYPDLTLSDFNKRYPGFPEIVDNDPGLFDGEMVLLPFQSGGKWGYMDSIGSVVVKPLYFKASTFTNGMALVGNNGKFGFVNKSGEEVIPVYFDNATAFQNGFATVAENGMFGVIDRRGKTVLPFGFDSIHYSHGYVFIGWRNGNCQFFGRDGQTLASDAFEACGMSHVGFAYGIKGTSRKFINLNGTLNFKSELRDLKNISSNRFAVKFDAGFALSDINGNLLTKEVFDQIGAFSYGLAPASVDGKFGYLDSMGRTRIPLIYEVREGFPENAVFKNGLAVVGFTERVGVSTSNGDLILTDAFDILEILEDSLVAAFEGDECILLNPFTEKRLTKISIDSVGPIKNGILVFKSGGSWGLMGSKGNVILEPEYESILFASNGVFVVKESGRYGLVDINGVVLLDPIYDQFHVENNRFLGMDFSGKIEWFDTFELKILQPVYK